MTTETLTAPAETGIPAAPAATSNTYSVLGLVLSILSIPTGMGVLAIAGVVLGFMARTREPAYATTANWAIVVGFVSLFWWVALGLLAVGALLPLFFTGAWLTVL